MKRKHTVMYRNIYLDAEKYLIVSNHLKCVVRNLNYYEHVTHITAQL